MSVIELLIMILIKYIWSNYFVKILYYWLIFFFGIRLRRIGIVKIVDFLDDGFFVREEENKYCFKLKNEIEMLEMKLKGKNIYFK